MNIDLLRTRLREYGDREAVIHNDFRSRYSDIAATVNAWMGKLEDRGVAPGTVVSVIGDYSADAIALVIALIQNRNIVVPVTLLSKARFEQYWRISQTQHVIHLTDKKPNFLCTDGHPRQPELIRSLIDNQRAGLILFTSGSTGEPKGVVHDFDKLLSKFMNANKSFRTLCFLMFDHIAGIDTYFYSLFSGGTAVLPHSRSPRDICALIEKHRVEVLPTSPTFLNLLLLSEDYKSYDLSSLRIITFGSERMPEHLLFQAKAVFGNVRLIQKYGITELGSPSSKSKEDDPTWIKMDSDKFRTRVVDGILQIKADTAMMGYLNAPSPFTEDGWFITGDAVEIDGDYMKILGRASEIISVGGEKVYPVEVENVIQEMENVEDVTVLGEKNPIMGKIVCANVKLIQEEDPKTFVSRLKDHCRSRLERHKIPVKVNVVAEKQHTERFKKVRM